jgi:hypothetical protein
VAIDEAENRLHVQKAPMLGGRLGQTTPIGF